MGQRIDLRYGVLSWSERIIGTKSGDFALELLAVLPKKAQ